MKWSMRIQNPQQAEQVMASAREWARPILIAGHRLVLEIRQETRSDAQNRLLHSRLQDVAKHCQWAGQKLDVEDWKRLMTAAWCRTRNEGVRIIPALDGQGFDVLYQRTSKLTRSECVELSDYIFAWGSEREVQWRKASLGRELAALEEMGTKPRKTAAQLADPETGEIMEEAHA